MSRKKLLVAKPKSLLNTNYELGEILGEGSYGIVHSAIRRNDSKHVAIKILNKSSLSEADEKALKVEYETLKNLAHPNIVTAYDLFEDESKYFVVMEKISGGELFDRIVEKQVYTEKEARDVISTILNAFLHLHSLDFVHRDLKPENLMLTSKENDSDIKLIDFGLVAQSAESNLVDFVGTPAYMAPEVVMKQPYGKAVDVWAIGVILYILLSGSPPFSENTDEELFEKIKQVSYELTGSNWSIISEDAKCLVRKLLDPNPTTRITAEEALNHKWMKSCPTILENHNLSKNLEDLKRFQIRRKMRAGVRAVIATNKLKSVLKNLKKASEIMNESTPETSSSIIAIDVGNASENNGNGEMDELKRKIPKVQINQQYSDDTSSAINNSSNDVDINQNDDNNDNSNDKNNGSQSNCQVS
eukprot:gene5854-8077_t